MLTNTGTSGSTTTYTTSVTYATVAVTVTPTTTDPNAAVTVNGTSVASGTASGNIALAVGANTITTVVTAQDGVTTQTYVITATRAAPSNNAYLGNLTESSGTLSPAFSSLTTNYTASIGNAVTGITVTPTVIDPTATITVALNGGTPTFVASGGPLFVAVPFGTNNINTVVTAQDGTTTQTYTIAVTGPGHQPMHR